jgi:3-hydroxyisobutyrate dehydrogenase-like beta-hydroxyacid dehydrogenase
VALRQPLGFVGLGAMGGNMVGTLLRAGYAVLAYDIRAERVAACTAAGALPASDAAEVAQERDVVLLSLRSSETTCEVARTSLLPVARSGQTFVDLGTTSAPQTRVLAQEFAGRGASWVDAPVSGGPGGSASGSLRIFIGGAEASVRAVWHVFEALGDPAHTVYCGPSGCGQVVKGVNQLAMGLGAAAYMEAIAFGVHGGVGLDAIRRGVGGDSGFRAEFDAVAAQIARGNAASIYVKFPELPYFLAEAAEQDVPLPLTEALHRFLDSEERSERDNMGRPTVSFWKQMIARRRTGGRST